MLLLIISLWIALGIWIMLSDLFRRTITNTQVFCVFLCGALSVWIYPLEFNFYGGIIVFIIGFSLWRLGFIGAGDVKLLSVMSFLLPKTSIFYFLFLVSIIGFLMAAGILVFSRFFRLTKSIPYGIGIVVAFWVFFLPMLI